MNAGYARRFYFMENNKSASIGVNLRPLPSARSDFQRRRNGEADTPCAASVFPLKNPLAGLARTRMNAASRGGSHAAGHGSPASYFGDRR
jgi:hypothetical protein